jgi:N-acetylmuramoyl-L-alanine amidase
MWNSIIVALIATCLILFMKTEEVVTVPVIEIEKPKQVEITISKKELECLAKNIYFEARGEPTEGQIAVAAVTLNRVNAKGFPDSICKVVHQPYQFSWVYEVKSHVPRSIEQYEQAKQIALDYMQGKLKDPTKGATFYHANYVNPKWNKHVTKSATIGAHIFYVK